MDKDIKKTLTVPTACFEHKSSTQFICHTTTYFPAIKLHGYKVTVK